MVRSRRIKAGFIFVAAVALAFGRVSIAIDGSGQTDQLASVIEVPIALSTVGVERKSPEVSNSGDLRGLALASKRTEIPYLFAISPQVRSSNRTCPSAADVSLNRVELHAGKDSA